MVYMNIWYYYTTRNQLKIHDKYARARSHTHTHTYICYLRNWNSLYLILATKRTTFTCSSKIYPTNWMNIGLLTNTNSIVCLVMQYPMHLANILQVTNPILVYYYHSKACAENERQPWVSLQQRLWENRSNDRERIVEYKGAPSHFKSSLLVLQWIVLDSVRTRWVVEFSVVLGEIMSRLAE